MTPVPDQAPFNTPTIANSGAALLAMSTTALGTDIVALVGGQHPALLALIAPFVGIGIGGAMAYFGRPPTVKG